jgi:hypothetical protein
MILGRTADNKIKIKKDGVGLRAVNCACCVPPPPTGCCAYTASGILNGLYTATDLPDEIKVYNGGFGFNGNIFTKSGNGYCLALGDGYQIEAQLIGVNYEWRLFQVGAEDSVELNPETPSCLYSIFPPEGDCASDTFADSYLIQGEEEIVTRTVSACNWIYEYTEPCVGSTLDLQLISFEGIAPFWYCQINTLICGGYLKFGFKDGPQNSPVGNYLDNFGDLVFTVS